MKRIAALGLLASFVGACSDMSVPSAPAAGLEGTAVSLSKAQQEPIAGSYIVVFKHDVQDVDGEVKRLTAKHAGKLKYAYKAALKGMALELSETAVAALRAEPSVDYVEPDQVMTISTTQSGATWGIDRVDQTALPLSGTYSYTSDGSGVTVYIIDTGMNLSHNEFGGVGGRASSGYDAVDGGSADDCNGHGTHVGGTVGGALYGIAKNVNLVAVRVLGCTGSGSTAGVIAGIDWVTANRVLPAAANMSLGGGFSSSLNQAVENSIAAGVTYAIAAGNSTANACNYSPASAPSALTVGATSITDAFASFSNFGSCVDINASGVSITSAWYTTNTATNTISGTSMAAPHVAGVAALYLGVNSGATPAEVGSALTGNATPGAISGLPAGTVNLLLYSGFIGGDPPPPPPPPDPVEVHVGDLSGTGAWTSPNRKNWRATVTITVHTGSVARSGVTVTGTWSIGGSTSCVTGAAGTCSVQSGNVSKNTVSVLWSVGSLSGSGVTYDPALNPNTPSNITVARP